MDLVNLRMAHAVGELLHVMGCRTFVLDWDISGVALAVPWASVSSIGLKTLPIPEMVKLFLEAEVIVLTLFNYSIGRGSTAGEGCDWSKRYCRNLSRWSAGNL